MRRKAWVVIAGIGLVALAFVGYARYSAVKAPAHSSYETFYRDAAIARQVAGDSPQVYLYHLEQYARDAFTNRSRQEILEAAMDGGIEARQRPGTLRAKIPALAMDLKNGMTLDAIIVWRVRPILNGEKTDYKVIDTRVALAMLPNAQMTLDDVAHKQYFGKDTLLGHVLKLAIVKKAAADYSKFGSATLSCQLPGDIESRPEECEFETRIQLNQGSKKRSWSLTASATSLLPMHDEPLLPFGPWKVRRTRDAIADFGYFAPDNTSGDWFTSPTTGSYEQAYYPADIDAISPDTTDLSVMIQPDKPIDLATLAKFKKVEDLTLFCSSTISLSKLPALKSVRRLSLEVPPCDISPLERLSNLMELTIGQPYDERHFMKATALSNLKALRMEWCYACSDEFLRRAAKMPRLEELALSDRKHRFTEAGVLALLDAPKLQSLTIAMTGMPATTSRPLASFTRLKSLTLINANLDGATLAGLEKLPLLEDVKFNRVSGLNEAEMRNWAQNRRVILNDCPNVQANGIILPHK